MINKCINCGAPIDGSKGKCQYCGTEYHIGGFYSKIDGDKGTITISGKTFNVYLANVEIQNAMNNRSASTIRIAPKRKFTLIEI